MEYIVALFYSFRQAAKFLSKKYWNFLGGNLDLFYIPALFYINDNYKDKKKVIHILKVISIFIIYSIIQVIFNKHIYILKLIINLLKIFICYLVFLYVKENYKRFNLFKITLYTTIIILILTLCAFIFNNSTFFWRFNDGVNLFSLTRLQLFYLEPSELGFHLMPLIFIFVTIFLKSKSLIVKNISVVFLVILLIPLYLAKSMGAIGIGLLSIVFMVFYDYYLEPSIFKRNTIFILVIVGILTMWILYITHNPLMDRLLYTLNGNDGSNNYRISVSLNVLKESFFDYKMVGCGFGNLHTDSFISRYTSLGLTTVVVNSFIYFIIETGIFGILIVAGIIFMLYKYSLKSKSILKFGLTTFIVFYSFVGGHFTSGLTWAFYGLIISDLDDIHILDQCNSTILNIKNRLNIF